MRLATHVQLATHVLIAAAIVAAGNTQAADAPRKSFELNIVRGAVAPPQRVLKVEKGDALDLTITSDAPGELHLHGYRLAATLAAGQPAKLAFTAHATGRYPFEWHAAGNAPAAGAHRRGPPLATLEVQPK